MKFNDIIALAKQGYKPDDIKELISLAEAEPNGTDGTEAEQNGTDGTETEQNGTDGTETEQNGTANADIANLQKQINDLTKQLNDSNEALKKAQAVNRGTNIAGEVEKLKQEQETRIADWAQSFM